jgi:hypothetical protein
MEIFISVVIGVIVALILAHRQLRPFMEDNEGFRSEN